MKTNKIVTIRTQIIRNVVFCVLKHKLSNDDNILKRRGFASQFLTDVVKKKFYFKCFFFDKVKLLGMASKRH